MAANIPALRRATHSLAQSERVSIDGIVELQRLLLADEPDLHGLREVPNRIGGSNDSPLGAEFVPPAPSVVRPLMADLVTYLNSGGPAPLVQAALSHAQFGTVHPFRDGNGRVGRALIHTVLVRRGLTRCAVLPISPVLLTRSQEYVQGLTSYRYAGDASEPSATVAVSTWITVFLNAVDVAVTQAVARRRREQNLPEVPRADSATARILDTLQEHPVLTTASAARLFDVSRPAATAAALEELAGAGVVQKRRLDRRTSCWLVTAYRLGGGPTGKVLRLSTALILLQLSGLEDLAYATANPHTDPDWQTIPEVWDWATHMTVRLVHPATENEAFAFIAVNVMLALAVLFVPLRRRRPS